MGQCFCEPSLKIELENEILTDNSNNERSRDAPRERLLTAVPRQRLSIEEHFLSRKKNIGPFHPKEPEDKEGRLFIYNIIKNITIIESGQEIETEFKIKLINMPRNYYSTSYEIPFVPSSIIKDLSCKLDRGITYKFDGRTIIFYLKLFNNVSKTIKFKYKSLRNYICKYYRNEFIGIENIFSGAVGKYTINIPNEYSVVSEENEIFYPEILHKKYIWEGVIPKDGLNEYFRISLSKAEWEGTIFQDIETINQNDHISHVEILTPKFFNGGNLRNKEHKVICSLGEGIDNKHIFDEGNKYKFLMKNVNSKKVFFQILSKFEIDIHLPWKMDLNDDLIPKIDDENKSYFKEIANDILKKSNTNYPKFYILGKFVNKYLKYNINHYYKDYTPKEIYELKEGVCSHFTLLFNTLLNSIDIPAIYVCGIANNGETQFNDIQNKKHAWTLAKINNKWIPLDATWGLLKGILPVSHVFQHYLENKLHYSFSEKERYLELKEQINYLGN